MKQAGVYNRVNDTEKTILDSRYKAICACPAFSAQSHGVSFEEFSTNSCAPKDTSN